MRLRFVLGEIGSGLRRNLAMTVSFILVTFVSLTFVGAGALLQMQIGTMKGYWYDRVEVSIFLCTDQDEVASCANGGVTEERRDALLAELGSDQLAPYVEQVYVESSQEAYDHYVEQFADNPAYTEGLTPEQMPQSLRVKLYDPEDYELLSQLFTGQEGVERVQDQRELLDQFFTILNRATLIAAGFAAVMLLAAVLLVGTTIRLSAFSRRRETGIMRLVGASKAFIQLPFVLEGIVAATVGAVLAVAGLWLGVRYLVEDWLATSLQSFPYIGTGDVWQIAPWLVLLGAVLAGVSSLVTLSRYLKV